MTVSPATYYGDLQDEFKKSKELRKSLLSKYCNYVVVKFILDNFDPAKSNGFSKSIWICILNALCRSFGSIMDSSDV